MIFKKKLESIKNHGGSNNAMITVASGSGSFTTRYTKEIPSKAAIKKVWISCHNGKIIDIDSYIMKNMTAGEVLNALRNAGVEFND